VRCRSVIRPMLAVIALAVFWWGAGVAVSAAPPQSSAQKSIDGVWLVDYAENQLNPYPELVGATVTFSGDTFRIERPGRAKWFGDLKVDYSKGTIDMVHRAKLMIPPVEGVTWQGIFRWDGDKLEICHAEGHDARPTEFLSGYDLTLMKLRRQ
jgi:uncharacterized protein (TIGR03067 family)